MPRAHTTVWRSSAGWWAWVCYSCQSVHGGIEMTHPSAFADAFDHATTHVRRARLGFFLTRRAL